MQKKNNISGHQCSYCGETYRKQDYNVCPHCGGDGGGVIEKKRMEAIQKETERICKEK